jgi:cob(I)alamin adenosyltransferase
MTKVYTRLGDDGSTGLLFGGRISKASPIVAAYGTVDEAVAALGVARAGCADPALAGLILRLQRELFVVAADLAANPRAREKLKPGVSLVTPEMVAELEATIDRLVAERPLRPVFVVPGANPCSAALDLARAIVRRAERLAVEAGAGGHPVSPRAVVYLNRVSDLVYVLARHAAGEGEEPASHE